ncbi:MAG: adenylyl-sulfate kinase [Bacteroidetes bacterium]|jgi:adenylyl-sulfate kinase|nr:adenylyl-sulfate kinase [Bacteroidota bacterium]
MDGKSNLIHQNRTGHSSNPQHLFKHISKVSRADREQLNNNKAFTIWLTGLSASGKSTIANEVEAWMFSGQIHTYVLDGDNTRSGINKDLSFSDVDRAENIRRVAEICKLFNDAGVIAIAALISPFAKDRLMARNIIGNDDFIELFIDCSLHECINRDPKGLYKLALEGQINNFTGINSPYEPPQAPDLHLHTDFNSVDECVHLVKNYLINKMKFAENI